MAKHIRPAAVPQNLLDKAIAYFAPKLAYQRMQARMALAVSGGYTGARLDRASLAAWRTAGGSPDTDIIADLPMLRSRSRDLVRNAPVATGALGTTVTHVVGTGLACTPQIDDAFLGLTEEQAKAWQDDTKRRFNAWAESTDCDLARNLTFYGIQELAFRAMMESGDSFVTTPRVARPGRAAQIALQVLEADRVCNPRGQPDDDTRTDGIVFSAETGEAIAIDVAKHHPGDLRRTGQEWTRVQVRGASGRRNVIHLFEPLRPQQRRGVPWFAPVIEPLKQLGRYTEAELQAAVTSGLFSLFVKMDPDAFDTLFEPDAKETIVKQAGKWSGELEAGKAINLLPGEEIQSANPGRPNAQFDPFVQAVLRQVGMALGIPFEVLVMHYQSSYSAARAALLMAWRMFRKRRDFLATHLCQPVYELWLSEEVAAGRIAAPGFFASDLQRAAWCGCVWVGDGPGSIDPTKEVQAASDAIELGISTRQAESLLHDGVDYETKHRQLVKEKRMREADGLSGASAPAMPTPPVDAGEEV